MPRPVTTRLQSALAILIALLITLPIAFSASAQDLDATAVKLDIEELAGVEAAVSRSYAMDIGTMVEAATSDTPVAVVPSGPILMLALVVEFDSEDHAADAADTVLDRLQEQLSTDATGIEMEVTEAEDLGDNGWQFSGTRESGTSSAGIDGYLVQDADWLYLAIAISDNDTGRDATLALVQFSLDNVPDASATIYDHTGLSRGGIWAKLPADGDTVAIGEGEGKVDALSGTQPIYDNQLLPPAPPEG